MTSVSVRHLVDSTLASVMDRLPAYQELGHRFGPLLREKAALCDALRAKSLAIPTLNQTRLAAGVSVLVDEDMHPWADAMRQSGDALLPLLAEVLQLEPAEARALREYLDDPDNLSGLAQARIEGNWKHFETTSMQLGIAPPTTLLYISETVFAPVLCVIAASLGEPLSSLSWGRSYCPVCGSAPSISYLSPKEVTDLDQLVGGGGKKYLHCSTCGHDWRFKRNVCPSCGNDENESREVFTAEKVKHERIEACHKCGTYCLNIDLRECDPRPDLDALQLGLIHLDMVAQTKELSPMTPTLWNTIE